MNHTMEDEEAWIQQEFPYQLDENECLRPADKAALEEAIRNEDDFTNWADRYQPRLNLFEEEDWEEKSPWEKEAAETLE